MSVRVTRLANGLTVASDHMTGVPSVSLGVWVGVGTRDEPAEHNGVAHLLEHMAFKGTTRRSAFDIAAEIEAVGGQLNAYTGREQTAYYAKVLADDAALAVDILADLLQHSLIDPEELGRERTVVLQEIGQAMDTPDDIIFDHFQATAFPGQGLGRPVLGTAEVVRGLDREAVLGYLNHHYAAPGMVITAAGGIEHDAFVDLVARSFTEVPTVAANSDGAACYHGGEFRQDKDLEQVHLVLGLRGVGLKGPDQYTASVLSTLFGGGMSSRLFQEVRERRGLVYSIYSFASCYLDEGVFAIYAGTGDDALGELIPVVCDQLGQLTMDIAESEIDSAKAQLKAGLLMGMESSGNRCEQLANQLLIYGRPLPVAELIEQIDAVDATRLKDLAGRLLASPPTMAAMGPIGGLEPLEQIASRLG